MGRKISLIKNHALPIIIFTLVIVAVFRELPKTFYQQDEWLTLGNMVAYGWEHLFLGSQGPFRMLLGAGRIASTIITYFLLGSFPFNVVPITLYGILLHIVNTILVYRLIDKFLKRKIESFIGALLFAANSVSHQAVTWPAAVVGTLAATTLILLSFFAYFKFLDGYASAKQYSLKRWWLVVTIVLIYLSFHFKEIGIFLVIFLPLMTFFLKRELFFSKIKLFLGLAIPLILFVFYRIIELRLRTTESNLFITGLQENFFFVILIRTVFYPLTSFSQMFVPGGHFLSFAREIMDLHYPFIAVAGNAISVAQSVVLDFLSILLTGFIVLLVYAFLKRQSLKSIRIVIFWLAFSLMGFLPYVLLSKDFSYLEGRYYYLPVAGGAFLFAWILKRIKETFGKKIFFGLVFPLSVLYLMFHSSVVKGAISEQVRLANMRRDFMVQLKTFVPSLDNNKNVFYIAGDQNYWADGNKIPFQQGTGYTLMVLYNDSGKIPKELLKEEFLFEIGGQGYQETGEYGFGYFWEKEELEEAVELHNLTPSSIISLYYDSQDEKLNKLDAKND